MKSTATTGTNAVDWEARVDMDRLRTERLGRLKADPVRASAEDVFSAWLSPPCIEQWMFGRVGQDEQIVLMQCC